MSIERIKKLLGMTTDRGCSEFVAMQAAAKAAKLMAELGLRPGDIEMDQEDVLVSRGAGSIRSRLWSVIGAVTNCSPLIQERRDGQTVSYIGREPYPEIAAYLHQVTDRAIDRELRTYRATSWYKKRRTLRAKRQASSDFTMAMIRRLTDRLVDLFAATMSEALLEAAEVERSERYPGTQDVKPKVAAGRYYQAYEAGNAAAESVSLSHAVNGGNRQLAIGSGT